MKLRTRTPGSRYQFTARVSIGFALCFTATWAQSQSEFGAESVSEPGPKRTVSVVPRVSVVETFTDNVLLSDNSRQSDQITEVSPGIRISSEGGQISGYFDYALNGRIAAQNSSGRNFQQTLNAFGSVELVQGFAFVEIGGGIARQAISALGAQSTSTSNVNANITEATTLRISPYFRGRLGGVADYEARYSVTSGRNGSALTANSVSGDAQLTLTGSNAGTAFGWSVNASRQRIDYSEGRLTEADSVKASLRYQVTPQFEVSVTGGQEWNNYVTVAKEVSSMAGIGANWHPSDTTAFSFSRLNRAFGESHNLSFEHRTARTVWRVTDTRDITVSQNQSGNVGLGSTYDLYFAQFAALEPDPVRRAELVNSFLQTNGISPDGKAIGGFLTSAVSLQRRQELSFALLGLRDTITFSASQSEGVRLDSLANVVDDLSNSALVRQRGLSVSYAHRLTPHMSFNLLGSTQQSSSSLVAQDATINTVNFTVTGRVNNRVTAVVGARRVVSENATSPYSESAITGTMSVQF